MAQKNNMKLGEQVWSKMSKVNAELLTLTYGSMITQLIRDYEDINSVNEQLEKMGYNIGVRLIDEFLAKSGVQNCSNFKETADVISKVAFKMFLGISPEVTAWNKDNTAFSLLFTDNPLIDFVELPPHDHYMQLLRGIPIMTVGALEMIQVQVTCRFVRDSLKGDEVSELRVELKGYMKNEMAEEYQDN